MIDADTKSKLLTELEKYGNVYYACNRIGIARATYYRWLKEDSSFKKSAKTSMKMGRDNFCDAAEHSLALLVKDKDFRSIAYVLSHNSSRYKHSPQSKVILEHRTQSNQPTSIGSDNLTEILKLSLKKQSMRDNVISDSNKPKNTKQN